MNLEPASRIRPMSETTAGAALYEARRAIAEQGQRLESVRSRSGFLFAANAVATSFLGGLAFAPAASIGTLTLASLAATLFAIDAALILWLRSGTTARKSREPTVASLPSRRRRRRRVPRQY